MPTTQEILDHLQAASREARWLAAAWHAIVGGLFIAGVLGWRPDRSRVGRALAIPLLSSSGTAWIFGNPFNGLILFALAAALWVLGGRLPEGRAALSRSWVLLAGLGLVGFACGYPAFLDDRGVVDHLLHAPMGVIPCPTLALVLGVCLLFEGCVRREGLILLALAGTFYGCFGWWSLGVAVDSVLAAGSILVLIRSIMLGQGMTTAADGPASV